MQNHRSNRSRQEVENPWRRLALASGHGGGPPNDPPKLAADGGDGKPPWSLTAEYNRAANKPDFIANNPARKQQIADLRKQMQEAARKQGMKPSRTIVSRRAINAMQKQLSQPKTTLEITPLGSVTRSLNPERDRQLALEIKRMQQSLKQNRGKAMTGFNQSAGFGR